MESEVQININRKDFGTLCICAVRYCHGRQTYMPSLVQSIVRKFIGEISDMDLEVMIEDCDFQKKMKLYGDEYIDKPGWLKWEQFLQEEKKSREKEEYYIFTFGYGQKHVGHYVKIKGTYGSAREKMVEKYGNEWAFQYSEKEWQDWLDRKPDYIPAEKFLEEIT